ncbi:hypothetical protein SteCoe_36970 [Stentor coeruleus]|uniref:Uncharacterized protein n=1 Tax=Stentor coeruleus TaxID=5963 RepID=A0A1R2ANX9_9CILI|nr:hypothetical protein SteCoe_36970 [Stentor coeruleus]
MVSPRYENPTISTTLYEFTNREQDLIRQAFNSKNYTYMYKLPAQFSPSRVSESIKSVTEDKVKTRFSSVPKKLSSQKWVPDAYENLKKKKFQDFTDSVKKQREISPTDFKKAGNCKKLKYEHLNGQIFTYKEDSFSAAEQQANRIKWIKKSNYIQKEFKSPVKSSFSIAKNRIKEIISLIHNKITKDWKGIEFTIEYSSCDLIEIKFFIDSIENKKALHSYMNNLQEKDNDIQEFSLKKILSSWGIVSDCFVIYFLSPPWVRMRNSDVLSALFPHFSSISTSRTGKNHPGTIKSTLFNLSDSFNY